jgi:phosphoribosylaminoimidazole (AIR) synthetase
MYNVKIKDIQIDLEQVNSFEKTQKISLRYKRAQQFENNFDYGIVFHMEDGSFKTVWWNTVSGLGTNMNSPRKRDAAFENLLIDFKALHDR